MEWIFVGRVGERRGLLLGVHETSHLAGDMEESELMLESMVCKGISFTRVGYLDWDRIGSIENCHDRIILE